MRNYSNTANDAFDPALWETFVSTTLGLEVPALAALPRLHNSPRDTFIGVAGCRGPNRTEFQVPKVFLRIARIPNNDARRPPSEQRPRDQRRRLAGAECDNLLSAAAKNSVWIFTATTRARAQLTQVPPRRTTGWCPYWGRCSARPDTLSALNMA